jgi:exodeoxyribonuclease-1
VFSAQQDPVTVDPEFALYAGFLPNSDRARMAPLDSMSPQEVAAWVNREVEPFTDERLNALLLRFAGRHAPEALEPVVREEWETWRRKRLLDDPELGSIQLDEYRQRLVALRQQAPEHAALLDALDAWPAQLGLT